MVDRSGNRVSVVGRTDRFRWAARESIGPPKTEIHALHDRDESPATTIRDGLDKLESLREIGQREKDAIAQFLAKGIERHLDPGPGQSLIPGLKPLQLEAQSGRDTTGRIYLTLTEAGALGRTSAPVSQVVAVETRATPVSRPAAPSLFSFDF